MVTLSDMAGGKLIYLSLGSNLGDREANLARATGALSRLGVRVSRCSSIYETEPVDFLSQPWFLNCLIEAETSLAPGELLGKLQSVEQELGRQKGLTRGPRIIDLDILFYGDEAIHEAGIEIPHPRLANRRFVLIPLVELAPEFRHPVLEKTAAEMLAATKDRSVVRLWQSARGKMSQAAGE